MLYTRTSRGEPTLLYEYNIILMYQSRASSILSPHVRSALDASCAIVCPSRISSWIFHIYYYIGVRTAPTYIYVGTRPIRHKPLCSRRRAQRRRGKYNRPEHVFQLRNPTPPGHVEN